MPKISIVILTFNSSAHILGLLESIYSSQVNLDNIEIVIVDNASDDNTLNLIKNSGLKVDKIRELPKNIGFAAGINAGVKSSTGEYLLFLNPDTKMQNGNLIEMTNLIDKDKVGVVGGKMVNENVLEKSAGKELNLFSTFLLILGLDEKFGARFSPAKEEKVGFVSGGFMLVSSSLFKKLNGFDEDFFMYVEDADLCKRAKDFGFATLFTPDFSIEHAAHGSSNREFAITNICSGIILYHKKHSSKTTQLIVKSLIKLKANTLVLIGKVLNNKYLVDAYIDVTRL